MRNLVCQLALISGSLSFAVSTYGLQQPIRIEAGFAPAAITLRHPTTYKVTIHGSQQFPKCNLRNLPRMDGLSISNNPRIFRSASFFNGVPSVRLDMFEEGIKVIKSMWHDSPANFEGTYYKVDDVYCEPRPTPKPVLMLGGGGEKRTLKIVAEHGDWWNDVMRDPKDLQRK